MLMQDHIYGLILFISIFAGFIVRKASPELRRHLCLIIGISLTICICGWDIWHSILLLVGVVILNSSISYRFINYAIFLWGFSYLGFFHTSHNFGFSKPSPFSKIHFLLIILRVIGISFEIYDTYCLVKEIQAAKSAEANDENSVLRLKLKHKGITVSSYDILSYAFSYIGIITGPYYSYRTYNDMIRGWPSSAPTLPLREFFQRLYEAPFFIIAYFISSHFFSLDYVRTADFLEHNFLYRFSYMNIIFFMYRMRMYSAWLMAECSCMAAGLGAYPVLSNPVEGAGPTDLDYLDRWLSQSNSSSVEKNTHPRSGEHFFNFKTIHNIETRKLEFSSTIRESLRSWNMTVQYWLSNIIYRRLPAPKFIRSFLTLLTSAFWHGVDPGYYLSFLVIPFALVAEEGLLTVIASLRLSLPSRCISFLRWLLKMSSFSYLCMGFLILDWSEVITFWSSLNYVMHAIILILVIFHLFLHRHIQQTRF